MNFHVGQKIVCVKDSPWRNGYTDEACPTYGNIYTIRAIKIFEQFDNGVGLHLCEIVNAPREYQIGFTECFFQASRFRPLAKRKTDISIFQEMLLITPKKQSDKLRELERLRTQEPTR